MPKLKVTITTLHCVYASKNASLFIKFIGENHNPKPIPIQYKRGWDKSPLFRQWEKDTVEFWFKDDKWKVYEEEGKQTFKVKVPKFFNLRNVNKIEIGYDHSRFVDGWLIGSITVEDSRRHIVYFNGPGTYGYWHRGSMTLTAERFLKIDDTFLPNRFVVGPILSFRGTTEIGLYQLSCLVVTEGLENQLDSLDFTVITADGTQTIGSGHTSTLVRPLSICGRYKLWRYDWEVPRDRTQDYICKYTLPDHRSFTCHVPSFNTYPRVAFATSSGLEKRRRRKKSGKDRHCNPSVMWIHMRNAHKDKPFHLLVMGGDNVYADEMVTNLIEDRRAQNMDDSDVTGIRDDARRKYFELYINQWRQPEQACMMARIPTLMIWDDHDIFNGWGSVTQSREQQEIYKAAKEFFVLFQLKGFRSLSARPAHSSVVDVRQLSVTWLHPPPMQLREAYYDQGPFSHFLSFGDVAFMLLDHRSERTIDRIMSEDTWQELTGLLHVIHGVKHLFVVIPVPIIYVDSEKSKSYVKTSHKSYKTQTSQKSYTSSKSSSKQSIKIVEKNGKRKVKREEEHSGYSADNFDIDEGDVDEADQWTSPYHDFERKRLIKLLLDFSQRKKVQVTILSGDVYVGCWGKIESESNICIDVVTSSSIVNDPPRQIPSILRMMHHSGSELFCLPDHGRVRLSLDEITDERGSDGYLLAAQNFLILDPQTTTLGLHTGRYDATFVRRPEKVYEKTKPKCLILNEPKKYIRTIEKYQGV